MNQFVKNVLSRRRYPLIYLILFFCLAGCQQFHSGAKKDSIDQILSFKGTEPLSIAQNRNLDSIRHCIRKSDVERLVKFYQIKSFYYSDIKHLDELNHYADSALLLFQENKTIERYKNAYFDALLLKGDAAYLSKRYSQSVLSFLEASSFQQKNLDQCTRRGLAMRIGNVYYVQGKFKEAITYFKESYALELRCKSTSTPLKRFYDIQALLNTIGFSYERSNKLDSAEHFFLSDLSFIDRSRLSKGIASYAISDASAIAYDNLGSIYLKKGDLGNAEKYLKKSIGTSYSGGEDAKVPPLIKLSNLYTQSKKFGNADSSLAKAKAILRLKPDDEFQSRWHKAKSKLEQQKGNYRSALDHLAQHLHFQQRVNSELMKVSAVDIEKEFGTVQQKYELQDLEKRDAAKNLYLVFAAILLILGIAIVFLLYKNIRQSRSNHRKAMSHNAELQESLLKLEDANLNYARVMKVMAHDLRNPLGGISGLAGLLIAEDRYVEDTQELGVIKASADSALKMIDQILNTILNKNEEGDLPRTEIDLRNLLEQCVTLLSFKANEKNQQLVITGTSALSIKAHQEKLYRVFNNLIVNAIKFSHPKSTVAVHLEEFEKHAQVMVIDNGIGIPADLENKVYDIFTEAKRLGTSGEKPYGLGLSISKQIIEAHGGKIWYESNPEGGTIFYVQLPK